MTATGFKSNKPDSRKKSQGGAKTTVDILGLLRFFVAIKSHFELRVSSYAAGCNGRPFWCGCRGTKTLRLASMLLVAALGVNGARSQVASTAAETVVWRLEDPTQVGGHLTTVLGAPRVVVDAGSKALRFNGTSDGLIIAENPLAARAAFTIEVRFKPDADGSPAQRFVHVEDTRENRALIETRVTPEKQWYLDTFLYSHSTGKGVTLVDKTKLHACDRWYWAALVYDGKVMSQFVDGIREQEGAIDFGPMAAGRTSVGVRLNQVFWFKGEIAEIRFHPRAVAATALQRSR